MTASHHGPWTPIEMRAASFPWPSSESRRLRSLPLGHRQLQQHTRTPPDPKGIKALFSELPLVCHGSTATHTLVS
ncbi:hypothetical protein QC761_0084930 [Podospora bellae-mahoneyi]|uniref:Uncharacterized protein n=1 Tax=Podospora bellae-mahoneyi TaxID=2093777 RepID=A0ABR0FHC9_9PEZI|nr:hypothetical protein QC761_0084930 [Podospora bellae-mahoneyi]